MVYGIYNELVTGANLNQLITGGPHIVGKAYLVTKPYILLRNVKNLYEGLHGV